MPASFSKSAEADGIPTSISHFLVSESTETVTGIFIPLNSLVFSLIASITCMIFTPIGPNVGPRGGPAEASPPVISDETVCLFPTTLHHILKI
uniref:Uncharacterized protein n=1 Tax=uncultured marine crenarchaeote HF4000_APKG10F15 TaxID=455611 RepID=B3TBX0_9ARCH|nr:hypothetical protein ALOHA_HF4000APKG10F15ctg6g7 [uncultured marine crenarchaeote HF4000_APKG10F15]